MARVPVVLSIAGSDSGGGAGIQADLKAFARAGVHGTTAITAITAQNTVAVEAVEPVSPAMIRAQVAAVASDMGIDAVKISMVGGTQAIEEVAEALDALPAGTPVVLDGMPIGEVTSGTLSPTLQKSIAMAYVDADRAAEGTALAVDLKGTTVPAVVVKLPFYSRQKT